MNGKNVKFLFYLIITVFLTLGLTLSFQPILADWVAPNQSPPGGNLGLPVWNESGTPFEYWLDQETWIWDDFAVYTNNDQLQFYVDSERFLEKAYVGINVDQPMAELHVRSCSGNSSDAHCETGRKFTAIRIENDADDRTNADPADGAVWELQSLDNAYGSALDDGFAVWGGTGGSEQYRLGITTNGEVGIGTTDPQAMLDVAGDLRVGSVAGNDYMHFHVEDSGADYSEIRWRGRWNDLNNLSDEFRIVFEDESGGTRNALYIYPLETLNQVRVGIGTDAPSYNLEVKGSVAGIGDYNALSDERLKDINGSYRRGLEAVLGLEPVYYNFKKGNPLNVDSSIEHVGLIAQEVEKYIPEAVHEREDGYKAIGDGAINWAMLNAIKELKAENDELKNALCEIAPELGVCQ